MAGIWRKTLIYLGLVEDDELDEYGYDDTLRKPEERQPRRGAPQQPIGRRRQITTPRSRDAVVRPIAATGEPGRFHLVHPTSFNDAQEVGDKFREGFSVLMNLSTRRSRPVPPADRLRQRAGLRPRRFDAAGRRTGLSHHALGRSGLCRGAPSTSGRARLLQPGLRSPEPGSVGIVCIALYVYYVILIAQDHPVVGHDGLVAAPFDRSRRPGRLRPDGAGHGAVPPVHPTDRGTRPLADLHLHRSQACCAASICG